MKELKTFLACLCLNTAQAFSDDAPGACRFYDSDFSFQSFGNGSQRTGCANFSVVNGRGGCTKVKGVCPACVVYPGDHVQMWLPDYFVEVTRHAGKSVFTKGWQATALRKNLEFLTFGKKGFSQRGSTSPDSESSFWHVRVLQIPWGEYVGNYPPVASPVAKGFPVCFTAISEALDIQWNTNLIDAAAASIWKPVGVPMCLSAMGKVATEGVIQAKKGISEWAGLGGVGGGNLPVDLTCARRIGLQEAKLKSMLPTAAALAPITSGSLETSLCMGTWGNLLPRTGTVLTTDETAGAMQAAYKFLSLAADMHLSPHLNIKATDRWQLVWPAAALKGKCFTPGSALSSGGTFGLSVSDRMRADLSSGGLSDGTYIIAVWRKRTSCEEPFELLSAWSSAYKVNFEKNRAICRAVGGGR